VDIMAKAANKVSKKVRKALRSPEEKAADMARKIGVPEAQISRGFAQMDVVERGQSIGKTVRILYPNVVDRWLAEGGIGFDDPQRQAISWVRGLWEKAGHSGPVTSAWGEQRGSGAGDGQRQQDALTQLAQLKAKLPRPHWECFENLVRFDMAASRAGAELGDRHAAQQIAGAKACVGFVASLIAMWRGF
jgi:hypothetical protein